MSSFTEANQVRLALKMKFSQYAWYSSSVVYTVEDGFAILIGVKFLNDKVRKVIPPVVDGVAVRTEVE